MIRIEIGRRKVVAFVLVVFAVAGVGFAVGAGSASRKAVGTPPQLQRVLHTLSSGVVGYHVSNGQVILSVLNLDTNPDEFTLAIDSGDGDTLAKQTMTIAPGKSSYVYIFHDGSSHGFRGVVTQLTQTGSASTAKPVLDYWEQDGDSILENFTDTVTPVPTTFAPG